MLKQHIAIYSPHILQINLHRLTDFLQGGIFHLLLSGYAKQLTFLTCMFCFPISDHMIVPWRSANVLLCTYIHMHLYA